ncbi:MAG: M23 family metallopeptidase [Clostridium sp.]|uniref:M23 family metallopeptidase n=1 Tax=Clostridium sp. TaxID=1506 RepID=UPI003050D45B
MNNKLNKVKQFFKKEGFYVILFVCLCAVATVAAVTAGRNSGENSKDNNNVAIDQTEKEVVVQPERPENALQVKEELEEVPVVQNDEENGTQAVSAKGETSFNNPVEGTLGRAYSEEPVYWATTKSHKTHLAMDIKAEEGASVKASAAGVVKSVGVNTEGAYVEVDHQNGLTTIYGNLNEEVAVKKGDTVTINQELGVVGKTTNLAYEDYGTYLHFQMLKDGKEVDPAKYVSYNK